MHNRFAIPSAFLVAALCNGQPTQSASSAALVQRASEIQKLAKERNAEEKDGGTAVYAEMRRIVQEQVLETLSRSEKPEDVREALKLVLGYPKFPDDPKYPFVFSSDLQGLKAFVAGYSLLGPEGKVAIDGFRKVGLVYELVTETGAALNGCNFVLEELDSPRQNETWFLGYGHAIGGSHYWVPIQIYSFDGYNFKELWATDANHPPLEPQIQISKEAVVITYLRDVAREPVYRDTISLTVGGPIVSTITLPQ
jgi:hypothetical protein